MRIDRRHFASVKLRFGFKSWLLEMNRRMDAIKEDIDTNHMLFFWDVHSIDPYSNHLTNFETAILYLEDRRFFSHSGFEMRSMLRGIKRFITRGSINGISTIDQQVIRISTNRYERTFSRKFNEIFLAVCLNMHVPKRRILDFYMHNAYVGYRMQGCEVAAKKCFGIGAAQLDQMQAAFVASLYPLPFPKSVWEAYSQDYEYPFSDPQHLINFAKSFAPRWARRVEYRMNLATKSYDLMPKSL